MAYQDPKLKEIWNQKNLPVFYLPSSGKLWIRLPYSHSNFEWLKENKLRNPIWNQEKRYWIVPAAWYDKLVEKALKKFGRVYLIQVYRELQVCAPACWNARGYHCECSCMGANHGTGHPGGGWYELDETCALNWGIKTYACRLLKLADHLKPTH